jgi:hypothetical protein
MQGRVNAVMPLQSIVDHSANDGLFVSTSGSLAGAAAPFGIILEGSPVGLPNSIAICAGGYAGTVKVRVGGAIARGSLCGSNALSQADPSAVIKCCQLLEDSNAAGGLVEAVLFRPF